MTLPVSFPMSMSQIATELGLSLPLSINHPWVILLAGKLSLPVSFSDLLSQTGRLDQTLTGQVTGGQYPVTYVNFSGVGFPVGNVFWGAAGPPTLQWYEQPGNIWYLQLIFPAPPSPQTLRWRGNLKVTNNTTSASFVLPNIDSHTFGVSSAGANPYSNMVRSGITDSFTVLPSN